MSKFKRNKASLVTCLNNITNKIGVSKLLNVYKEAQMKLTLNHVVSVSYSDELKPKPNIPNGEDLGVGLIAGAHDCHRLRVTTSSF